MREPSSLKSLLMMSLPLSLGLTFSHVLGSSVRGASVQELHALRTYPVHVATGDSDPHVRVIVRAVANPEEMRPIRCMLQHLLLHGCIAECRLHGPDYIYTK